MKLKSYLKCFTTWKLRLKQILKARFPLLDHQPHQLEWHFSQEISKQTSGLTQLSRTAFCTTSFPCPRWHDGFKTRVAGESNLQCWRKACANSHLVQQMRFPCSSWGSYLPADMAAFCLNGSQKGPGVLHTITKAPSRSNATVLINKLITSMPVPSHIHTKPQQNDLNFSIIWHQHFWDGLWKHLLYCQHK